MTTEYRPDPIGGWLYEIITNVQVNMKKLSDAQADVDKVKQQIADLQAHLEVIEPKTVELANAMKPEPAVIDTGLESATSTPVKL